VNDREDIFRLLSSINERLPATQRVSFEVLTREYELLWPDLKKKLDQAAQSEELETHTGFPWLYNADDVAHRQEDTATNAVWIITADAYRNILNDGLKKALQHNIDRGLQYTFVMPRAEPAGGALEALKRIALEKPGALRVNEISAEEFRHIAVTDYIVVNPDSDSMAVFLELQSEAGAYRDVAARIGRLTKLQVGE